MSPLGRELVVNVREEETRVAMLEEGQLVEVLVERSQAQRLVGNIYRGRVENVLPGMQAAFVNIGLEKNAFLYVDDAVPQRLPEEFLGEEETPLPQEKRPRANITDVVKEGQELLVQITKEPLGTKGARITTHITLPGRYLVLMPTVDYVGVSRRIEDEEERQRLRELAEKLRPPKIGVIVRTVAEGMSASELQQDLEMLLKLWKRIQMRSTGGGVPSLVHRDLDLVQRLVRDLFTEEIERVMIDQRHAYEKVLELLDLMAPQLKYRVQLFEGENLFQRFNLEAELEKALKRRVWLKSGGYLVIDQTEALTAIDVNTGKYVGQKDLEETVLHTNLEAAREIVRQMRLRNLGGIIIVDFIDMATEEHRQQVLAVLEEEIRKDRTKTHVLGITQLGLVEITRKKTRSGLESLLMRPCPYCEGRGLVLSEETVAIKVRQALYELCSRTLGEAILVEVHPAVAALLIGSGGSGLRELESRTRREILIRGNQELHLEQFNLRALSSRAELENNIPVKLGQVLQLKVEEPHTGNPRDGIARYHGFVINIDGGGAFIGEKLQVEVTRVQKTSARARILRIVT
ncbi:ribonuclease G [Carboxydocella sporoproducens DSM 16521]|uniref:Ribonuclease G n=2 Tax=Carboxydocella TaxID=178898 RepID=A0A1T4L5I6_9FIRM|nr:RNAse G [Carboxydocella thermautotrophica]SJZ49807.1 ribonuclease G [Carboxydocella sporoproducens DSM 16521]